LFLFWIMYSDNLFERKFEKNKISTKLWKMSVNVRVSVRIEKRQDLVKNFEKIEPRVWQAPEQWDLRKNIETIQHDDEIPSFLDILRESQESYLNRWWKSIFIWKQIEFWFRFKPLNPSEKRNRNGHSPQLILKRLEYLL
jgi:hypothetical protein